MISGRLKSFLIFSIVLSLLFLKPLVGWGVFALNNSLYSHTILIPFISGYLVWLKKSELPEFSRGSGITAALPALVGCVLTIVPFVLRQRGWQPAQQDHLCVLLLGYLCFLASGAFLFLGHRFILAILFPVLFLVFVAPFPVAVENGIEQFFQRWSAEAAELFYRVTGTSYLRDGQVFKLPGISITVAQECSGVRSSLVLFITGLLAGHLFLRNGFKKSFLAFFVIPLGILRNAFRILTITLLCIHHDPKWIDSKLHHSGGPVFFVLSLVPFLLVLYFLRKSDFKKEPKAMAIRQGHA